ncbi:class I SAM-dependent methyltransferase [Pyxidicoccus xibeiensis]|uniref:class I SAM-dependent methyltransferase n=1 Tax=Pyxidicoccus xibeiensis TaxID=2906759 RepID=UPI0020A83514|nr:class I SAM-dependent methyltransferase [Pyxidicoccus xibeiensis]MCP3137655.1 class I SAM-dependent methyltransferase [Pyxidicoccus xibeiensis]
MLIKRRLKELLAQGLVNGGRRLGLLDDPRMFQVFERSGYHVTPNHFYQPIPDTGSLPESLWGARSEMVGVDLRASSQLELLERISAKYRDEYTAFPRGPTGAPHEYHLDNSAFGTVDAELLYCLVRELRPRRLFEIGSGWSTRLAAQACRMNASQGAPACELVAFEPYPSDVLRAGFPGLTRLEPVKAQDIPLSEVARLEENDILFIDSSHVLKVGSDVQVEFLELLPRLKKGVVVHIHDIFLPAEYPRDWVLEHRRFWTEQYLLQAFLSFNDSFEVLWGSSFMHLTQPERLRQAFPSYRGAPVDWPGSFWIRRVK